MGKSPKSKLTTGQGLPAPICSPDRGRWERSEWPHPKFPNHMRPAVLPDVIWIRIHTRGAKTEEVTGWQSSPPEDYDKAAHDAAWEKNFVTPIGREMKKRGIAYMVMILREDGKLAYVLDKEIPENAKEARDEGENR